jgi:hypothetical protein
MLDCFSCNSRNVLYCVVCTGCCKSGAGNFLWYRNGNERKYALKLECIKYCWCITLIAVVLVVCFPKLIISVELTLLSVMQMIRYLLFHQALGNIHFVSHGSYLLCSSVTSVIAVSKNMDKLFISCIYLYSVRCLCVYLAFL